MAVTSKRVVDMKNFKSKIRRYWKITDHRLINWFLGFQTKRDQKYRTISINQKAYIEAMVEKFKLTRAKKISTPMDLNVHFSIQQLPSSLKQDICMRGVPYAEAIGLVLWPTVVSRPETTFAVGVLSQFIQNLKPAHWEGVKKIISYMGSTKDLWLTFGGNKESLLEEYCNANWASQPHCHSILGFSCHFGHGVISWSSKKQHVITLLSTKAEYIAETHAAKEGIWLKSFIDEITGKQPGPLTIMGDNQGAFALVKDNKFHARTSTST